MAGLEPAAMRHEGKIGPKDEAGPRWLVTGFGPFPRVARNPAAVLAGRLARGWALRGWPVAAHVFATSFACVQADVPELVDLRPRAVLMLGVAARAKTLRVEMRALNRRAFGARDAAGQLPATPLIAPGEATFRAGRHKGTPLVQDLRAAGVPARASRDAGRYLCNFAYWYLLAALPGVPVVFVHVPMPRGVKKRDARPSLGQMESALRALMRRGL